MISPAATDALLDAALAYARRGWPVFPLHTPRGAGCSCGKDCGRNAGKHPRISGWQDAATTDEAQIRDFWRRWPDANIGIPTGAKSGILVVDRDVVGGVDTLQTWQEEHGLLPPGPTALTGGGGVQLYFAWPAGADIRNSTKEVAPDIDIRSAGGLVVAPPSLHRSGQRYEWLDDPDTLPPAPAWLLAKIAAAKRGGRTITAKGSGDDGAPPIPEGGRNAALTTIAGRMRWAGLAADEIVDALKRINRERCEPPLPEKEVEAVARSVGRYSAGDGAEASAPGKADSEGARALPFRSAREIAATAPADPAWLLRGYVAEGAIAELDGKIKSAGKTTLTTHLCRAMLDGLDFLARPTRKTPIVFLTEQSPATFVPALRRADLLDRDDFRVLFWHDTIGVSWPEIVAAARAEARRVGARLLVVDTVGQFSGVRGDAENAAGAALGAMAPLQEAAAVDGLAVVLLRHDRKSGGDVGDSGRGSSAFSGAVDVVLQLSRPEGQSRPGVRVLKSLSRFDETPDTLVIELTEAGYVAHGDAEAVATQEARVAVLKAAPDNESAAMNERDLLAAAEVKRTVGQDVLREHVEAGRIVRIGAGKRGDAYRYWAPRDANGAEGEKVSAGTTGAAAERNGHVPEFAANGAEKLSAALKVEVPAETFFDLAANGWPQPDSSPDAATKPVLAGAEFLSAATPTYRAAESFSSAQGPLGCLAECRSCGAVIDAGMTFCAGCWREMP